MSLPTDYYKVLNIDRSADNDAIKKAYRKMALKFHPEKNRAPDSADKFAKIAEAYDVLSDARRRAVYDQYGMDGLKNGVPGREDYEGYTGGYQFHNNPEETFSHFFGGKNPFTDFFSTHTEPGPALFGSKFGGLHGMSPSASSPSTAIGPVKDPPMEKELWVGLDELYVGCVKKMKVVRKIMNEDEMTTSPHEKILTIDVQKGWKEGTRITFPSEGDQGPNRIPADIIFTIKTKPHPTLTRTGNDLTYTANIPLSKALTGSIVDFTTLDGRILKIPVNEIVHPNYVKEIREEGMPLSSSPSKRGNLLVKFKIEFPTYLNEAQKKVVREILPG